MKRALLAGLMLVQGWAGACSPIPPSDEVQRAHEQLWQGISPDQSACQSQGQLNCMVYQLPAQQVAHLLAVQSYSKSVKNGQIWTVLESNLYGVITQIHPTRVGSLAQTTDRETAYEFISDKLNQPRIPRNLWKTCTSAGLTGNSAYKIQNCRWQGSTSGRRIFAFTISVSKDQSLPPGQYGWYADNGANCGGSLFRRDEINK